MSEETVYYWKQVARQVAFMALSAYLGAWLALGNKFDEILNTDSLKAAVVAGLLTLLNGLATRLKGDPNSGAWKH